MSQYMELNLTEYDSDQQSTRKMLIKPNVCVCCVSSNVSFIKLSSCEHRGFFETLFYYKLENENIVICHICHNELRKFYIFKTQVDENIHIFKNQINLQNPNKLHNLKRSYTTINSTINSLPLEVEFKIEATNEPEYSATTDIKIEATNEPEYSATTDIKIEHDSSDLDTDVPLSQIKKEIKKDKRKKTKSTPHGKYEGKIRIVTLSREELMVERERDRSKEMYQKLPYKCEYCIIGFDHDLTLKEHMEKRHTEKKGSSVCEICKSVLNTERSYKEHCKRHFRRYECEECGKRNNTLHVLTKHYNERHHCSIDTVFTCQQCGFTSESHRSYRYHRDKHKAKEQCTECGNTFVNKTALKMHMYTVHLHSSRTYSCVACNKSYRAKSGLLAHQASAHTTSSDSYCAPCGKHFRTPANLRHHLKTHSFHVSDSDKRFTCDECGSKFLTKPSLQEHVDWVHLNNTTHECTLCAKVFKNSSALKKHRDFVHEKKRPPRNKICDHCGRGFTTLAIMRSHIRTHTGERPLQCTHCVATFAHSAALYTHNKLLHSGANK